MFLEFRNITKRFSGVVALDGVSFTVEQGSCHALIGENGAGKSTLGKILAGIHVADSGEILLKGAPVNPRSPLAARQHGIAMVHQELAFCPNLSIAENLCLGEIPSTGGWVNHAGMREKAAGMLREIGSDLDPETPMSHLTTGQEQMVQIAAACGTGADVLIMDEPTSSLSARESEHLFRLLGDLKGKGITVLYVSHRMEEIFRLCDHITVLRDGKHVRTSPASETSPERVIHDMIGRDVASHSPGHIQKELGPELLKVENLSSAGKFQNLNFRLRAGEVLGFAGLVGAGRSEFALALFGLDKNASGTVVVRGEELKLASVRRSLRAGFGLLPEDRKRQGLVLSMNCRENSSLAVLPRLSRWGFIRRQEERVLTQTLANRLRVKAPSLETGISALSGGNQQKIALAKWLARESAILIIDEPTRGVDVGAKAEIHNLLDELACAGTGLIVISSELPEIMSLSRRIIVLREGRQQGELAREDFSQPALMKLMAGYTASPAPSA
jgi:ABC-type sugar transport system ATPase subunit